MLLVVARTVREAFHCEADQSAYIAPDAARMQTYTAFTAPSNRDAWATIRGFVYQADVTIDRWLSLEPAQELELECGEDIDTVSRYLEGRADERLLEQIKHRDANVTLKSGEALAALANAVEHRNNNPHLPLLFRFTTNARPGKELLSPFTGNLPGILAWSRLRLSEIGTQALAASQAEGSAEAAGLFRGIRQILSGAQTRPEDLSETTWSRFRQFVETAEDAAMRSLIRDFEWSTGSTAAEEMSDRIQQKLLEQGRASGPTEAYGQYQRLFLHVLKTLSKREGKRLTAAELPEILQQPLSEDDRTFFESFLDQMGLLSRRLAFLQAQMCRQEDRLDGIAEQIGRLLDFGRLQALTLQVPMPIFEPPPTDEHLSPRAETVGQLKLQLDEATWLELTGSSCAGKSHLALRLAARDGRCPAWLRFRDLGPDRAAAMLDSVLIYFSGRPIPASHRELCAAACRALGPNAVLVLDDLPDLLPGDPLAQRLELLVPACAKTGVKLITTSVNRVPGPLRRILRGMLCETKAPLLTDVEALEILQRFGAPARLLGDLREVRFLNNVARCHPGLLTAVALYLDGQGWEWTDDQFEALFLGKFADEVNEETIRRLLATVTDEAARDLLYRVNLVLGSFDLETVRVLAAVEPPIPSPRERLTRLTGLWVQQDAGGLFRVSPLVSLLGSDDLAAPVRRDSLVALAERLLQSGALGPYDLQNVVTYLAGAGDHERAARFLTWALSQLHYALAEEMISSRQAVRTGLASYFWDAPLPAAVSLNTRLLLRSQQVRISDVLGKDPAIPLSDLVVAADAAGEEEATGLIMAAVMVTLVLAQVDFNASCRCLTKALCAWPSARLRDGRPLELPKEFTIPSLLWWNLAGIGSNDDVLRWCDMLASVPEEMRRQALADPEFSLSGAALLMDRFWLTEVERPAEEQDWPRVLRELDEIESKARSISADFLIGAAARARVLVLSEWMHETDRAVAVAEAALAEFPDDQRIRFMVCDALGRKLSYIASMEHDAQAWLERADAAGELIPVAFGLERAITLLALARLIDGQGDAAEAASILSRAIGSLRAAPECPEIELTKMLGELALAEWKRNDYDAAFAALDDAIPRLLALKSDTPEWKALFTLFGHTAGYMASWTSFGHPPALEDGEPYILLPLGNFHDMKEFSLAKRYQAERELLLPVLMVQFAQGAGRDDRVAFWADRAVEMGQQASAFASMTSGMMLSMLPHLLESDRLAEFFNGAREATYVMVAGRNLYRGGDRNFMFRELDTEAILEGRGSAAWDEAEQKALIFTLVPLAVFLARLSIQARNDRGSAERLRDAAGRAVLLCQEVAAVSTRAEDWCEAGRLIEECYIRNPVMERVVSRANEFSEDQLPLRALAYLGATLELALAPKEALKGQMAVLPYCLQCFVQPGAYRLLLLPFIEVFWGWTVVQRRLCFSPPPTGEKAFAEAYGAPVPERAKRIMRAMALALGVRGDQVVEDGFQNWESVGERAH